MKKNKIIVAVLLVITLLVSVVGCKMEADLGDGADAKQWSNQTSLPNRTLQIEVTANKGAISFLVFTDINNVVIKPAVISRTDSGTGDISTPALPESKNITYKFDAAYAGQDVLLYIYSTGITQLGSSSSS